MSSLTFPWHNTLPDYFCLSKFSSVFKIDINSLFLFWAIPAQVLSHLISFARNYCVWQAISHCFVTVLLHFKK